MELKPVIASYSGTFFRAIQQVLDARGLGTVAQVALAPVERENLDAGICDELVEMHVLKPEGNLVRLDTAVFLEADIVRINHAVLAWGKALAQQVLLAAARWISTRFARPSPFWDQIC